jgi:hypothetical protein
LRAELKELVRSLLEALMREERAMYLETHPTSANGYYTRDLLTLVGPVEDLKVPRVREGDFHPRILPYRKRASLELSEIILALYAVGVSTRKISHFLEGIYGAFYSPQSISRLIQVTEEEVKAWRERPLSEEYYTVFLDGTFLSIRRGKTQRNPCTWLSGSSPMDEGRSSGFGSLVQKGKAPGIAKRFSRTSSGAGSKGYGSSSVMTFPGWRRRSRKSFPKRTGNFVFCTLCGMR